MKLSQLGLDAEFDTEITSLAFDTSQVVEGSLFFCLVGSEHDGHTFATEAEQRGAAALVVERKLSASIPQIEVSDTRSALAKASANFYGNAARKLKIIGVTGTNGKTTTTYILKSILECAGYVTGIIGTNAVIIRDQTSKNMLTTPDPPELHRIFKDMADAGVEYVIMEASAHALALRKLDGIMFEVAAFTNLSRDHLDFFEDMEAYAQAKKILFTKEHSRFSVINADDRTGREMISKSELPMLTYGCNNPADVFGIDLKMSAMGLEYMLNLQDNIGTVKFNLTGRFNMYNTLCAAAIAHAVRVPFDKIIKGIKHLKKVDGRFNIVNTTKCSIIIDFAHTDDGLANILNTIKEFAPKKVITVFGCGGNRDKTKRPVMGKIVSVLSDFCILTTDNPRFEPPMQIIQEIERGIKEINGTNYTVIADRKQAIKYAIEMAQPEDIVVVAGKGAEDYTEVMGVKEPYNDERYIMELAKEYKF